MGEYIVVENFTGQRVTRVDAKSAPDALAHYKAQGIEISWDEPAVSSMRVERVQDRRTIDSPLAMAVIPGRTIKQRRRELGLTQGHLAEQCEVTVSYISRIESDQRAPSPEVRQKLTDLLFPVEPA